MAKIVLDPGHGGSATIPNDSTWNNAVGPNGTLEKNLTLDVGKRAHDLLVGMGHTVKMTRTTDVNLRLRDRAKVAKDMKADIFVSIHFNGSTNHNAQGTETLVHTNFSGRSAKLSLAVQDAMLVATGLNDRNKSFDPSTRIKPQQLGVLRPASHHPNTAACLVETSFLDRADEEARLNTPAYLKAVSQALAKGINAHAVALGAPAPADFGDAIEISAGATDTVAFQNLESVHLPSGNAPAAHTGDSSEAVTRPRGTFSSAFVGGGMNDLALVDTAASPWPDLAHYVAFINGLNLRHFAPDEFLFLGASNNGSGSCAGKNSFPPRDLWPRIENTALMLDEIRAQLGAPIRILSCYRAKPYNSCIGGESQSLHMVFNAVDFTCSTGTPEIWRRVADRVRSSAAKFKGGIGVYPNSQFVHIDTRGSIANWQG